MLGPGVNDAQITRWALAAKSGDRAAVTAFVEATQHQVHRFLAHLVNLNEADDLTQETYLRALRALPGFQARSSARTWLLAIARRVGADHIRTSLRRPRAAVLDNWQAAADAARLRDSARFDDEVLLRQVLDGLAPERREAFVATQVLGLSYDEAAVICDCPVGTIRSRVARARQDLVAALRADNRGDGRLGATS
ncbi:sigma-70 family RNA polymerase sigma factor [Planosporangium thailandense]|uniref:RNA polymerase sigma factor n=1 Tax=Planosporangium thailandense TaxID=765197 RepID=A0ABX0Y2A5_9ACTN|nr:sigma-70 family RNA polymerase sigma factor [Planosporangium thailandense]NJC72463.1 sigma-70 family RNA polymerase sigma factor [Planosporangium thailandense]